jgi:hypothetical protein
MSLRAIFPFGGAEDRFFLARDAARCCDVAESRVVRQGKKVFRLPLRGFEGLKNASKRFRAARKSWCRRRLQGLQDKHLLKHNLLLPSPYFLPTLLSPTNSHYELPCLVDWSRAPAAAVLRCGKVSLACGSERQAAITYDPGDSYVFYST